MRPWMPGGVNRQGAWLWYIQSKKALALGWVLWRGISITPSFESKRGFQFEVPLRANQDVCPQTEIPRTVHKFHIVLKAINPPGWVLNRQISITPRKL